MGLPPTRDTSCPRCPPRGAAHLGRPGVGLKSRVNADDPSQRPFAQIPDSQRGPRGPQSTVTQPAPQALPVVTMFEGGSALSDFRARQLLPKLQAIEPR